MFFSKERGSISAKGKKVARPALLSFKNLIANLACKLSFVTINCKALPKATETAKSYFESFSSKSPKTPIISGLS